MSIMSRSAGLLRNLMLDFSRLSVTPAVAQVREKGHLTRPRLRNPYWFVRKNRVIHDDNITPENKVFVKEIIHETFGPPALIKGVQTYDQTKKLSLLKAEEQVNVEWTPQCRRTGLLARKIGQYPLWLKDGKRIRTTLLHIVDNHVVKYVPPEEYQPARVPKVTNLKKYGCLLVGAESADPSLLTKEYCGLFKDSGVMPKKNIARFLVTPNAAINPGTRLDVTHFRVGDFVDVRGKTVSRGFQGVVRRHGFKGMPASHGVTKTHRRPGNIGGGGEKGRVWPGTKLPGHMGNRYRKIKGLRIWRINTKYNVMWVAGSSVPGETNGLVYIYDTILPRRKPQTNGPPVPTNLNSENEGLPDDIWFEDVHCFKDPTITYEVDEKK